MESTETQRSRPSDLAAGQVNAVVSAAETAAGRLRDDAEQDPARVRGEADAEARRIRLEAAPEAARLVDEATATSSSRAGARPSRRSRSSDSLDLPSWIEPR